MPQRMGIRRLYPKPLSIGDLKPVMWLRVSHDTFQDIAKTTWSDRDSVIGAWEDQGHPKDTILTADVEQATTAKKPLRKQLGVLFDGSDDYLYQKVYEDETGASWGPANHGLSLVDGNAFLRVQGVDLSPFAGVEGTDTPYMVVLTDQAGKVAWGYLGAADAAQALAASLWDANASVFAGAGTYSWVAYGTNTIANDANSLKITYGNSATGAYVYLRDADDLSSDLTVGALYKLTFDAKVGAGDNVSVEVKYSPLVFVTETEFTSKTIYFTAVHATTIYLQMNNMSAGEIIWLDNLVLQEVLHAGTDAVHLVSTRNGATRNWAGIEAGLDYNDSAYTFEVRKTWAQITGALTVGCWVKLVNYAFGDGIISKRNGDKAYSMYLAVNGVRFYLTGGCYRDPSATIHDGNYHLVVCVFVPSLNCDVYTDGALSNGALTGAIPAALDDLPEILTIGARAPGTALLDGAINEAFILDYALDARRIKQLYEDNKERYT